MSRFSKKLVSIVSVICLLVSFILPAGILPTFADDTASKDPIVTKIDFSTGTKWADDVYREAEMSAEKPYVVTFEYFLESDAVVKFGSVAGSLTTLDGSSSATLEKGHHTFIGKYTTTAGNNTFAPQLVNEAKDAKLYMWNYSITLGGKAITKAESGKSFYTASSV